MFNWLLPGYGVPALGAAFAAWQLARTTDGRPRLVMEAAASFFALIGAAMLVRHAMNGGVLDADSADACRAVDLYADRHRRQRHPDRARHAFAEPGVPHRLDDRRPVSVAMVVSSISLVLNPLFTDESTGKIVFFNLLLLAYLLPALAAGGVALFARGRRPRWYVAMLALLSALLAFAYATLSLRRLFQGEFIGAWREFGQVETYAYSALWLALGVALLVGGRVPEVASAAHRLRRADRDRRRESVPVRHVRARRRAAGAVLHRPRHRADRHRPVLPAHAARLGLAPLLRRRRSRAPAPPAAR